MPDTISPFAPDTTIIIPTYNRPDMCQRAVKSALAQTRECFVKVYNDGDSLPPSVYQGAGYSHTGRKDHWYLTVYDAVHRATTPYVVILCDDDWLEPEFLARCHELMASDVAYAFTESIIWHDGGAIVQHWGNAFGHTGVKDARWLGDQLLGQSRIITPSCCLYRRQDVLRCLAPGGVPGFVNAMPECANPSGPDHLMALLPLLQYPRVAWVGRSLVNLDGGVQSTTMQELAGDDKGRRLQENYNQSRLLYFALRSALDHAREMQ